MSLCVLDVFRKVHVKVYSARVETEVSGVFTPTQKSWEKGAHPLESVSTATPRIFVLPPDPPMDAGMTELVKTTRSKPRSEFPSAGKITKMPDVAILDIKATESSKPPLFCFLYILYQMKNQTQTLMSLPPSRASPRISNLSTVKTQKLSLLFRTLDPFQRPRCL